MAARRFLKVVLAGVLVMILMYAALLIPEPHLKRQPAGERSPFLWNRDAYWTLLEDKFLAAGERDTALLGDAIEAGLMRVGSLLDSLEDRRLEPDSPILDSLESAFFELSPLVAVHSESLQDLVQLRRRLRNGIKQQSQHWSMDSAVTRDRLYRLLFGTRLAIEEILLQAEDPAIPPLLLGTDEPSVTPAAPLMGIEIHSGDMLASRGGAPTSALIARGSDYPGNFSHVALVHVDETTHDISFIEAHIETGVAIASAEDYLSDTKLRILILRMRSDHPALAADPMLPHKAATRALEKARREHIPYDFEMNFLDESKLFCSEVASNAYGHFGVHLWMGLSNISSAGVRSWLAAFGVRNFETQEPSDLEYDPQLSVVAEWFNRETLYQDHLDNAVIDAMLEQAETGEMLSYDFFKLPFARLLKTWSVILNLRGATGPVPEGMSATAALKNDAFSSRHRLIKGRLIRKAADFRKTEGYRPPYWELVNLAREIATTRELTREN